ncbi:zf-HC2 domain-containing protein [Micromonospora zhanjiangensis]
MDGPAAHRSSELGLYVLGVLDAEDREPVERHLARCPECRSEADALSGVVAAFASLSAVDRLRIVQEFGVRRPDARPGRTGRRNLPPPSPAARVRPRATKSPPRSTRRRPGPLVGAAGLAAVLAVLLAGYLTLAGPGPADRPGGPAPVAAGVDNRSGAAVSIRIVGRPDGSAGVQVTVTGLRDATRYQLYAVTADGGTRLVTDWTGSAAPQDLSADLPIPAADVAFFTVTLMDDTPVVSAYLPGAGTATPLRGNAAGP